MKLYCACSSFSELGQAHNNFFFLLLLLLAHTFVHCSTEGSPHYREEEMKIKLLLSIYLLAAAESVGLCDSHSHSSVQQDDNNVTFAKVTHIFLIHTDTHDVIQVHHHLNTTLR